MYTLKLDYTVSPVYSTISQILAFLGLEVKLSRGSTELHGMLDGLKMAHFKFRYASHLHTRHCIFLAETREKK